MNNKQMYWGYLHSNGTIQVKRWLGDPKDYTDDCIGNPFVKKIVRPFEATGYKEAYNKIEKDFMEDTNNGKEI